MIEHPLVKKDSIKISNSQIMDFQKCERRFLFAQVLKLRPKSYPLPMERGIFGHKCFELAFLAMKEGKSYEECIQAINVLLMDAPVEYLHVYRHVCAFVARAFDAEWEVVSVEENMLNPIGYIEVGGENELVEFAFTPDIVFRFTKGPHRDQYFMLDFKFTAQYWNDRQIAMFQQLPKYMIQWNQMHPDMKVRQLGVAMLNTRASQAATGQDLYLIKWLPLTKEKLERIEFENLRLAHRVSWAITNYTVDDYLRTVDSHQCQMCFFADDLCPADLNGKDTRKIIERNYEVNTYFDDNYEKDKVDGQGNTRSIGQDSTGTTRIST